VPIFDQGYQHWSGELSGHRWRWLAIARHGVRIGSKNRALRLLLIVSWAPALMLVFVLCLWGMLERKSAVIAPIMPFLAFLHPDMIADPKHYRLDVWTICYDFFLIAELYFSMIVVLLVGPNLISQDLRYNALPLYFSRPLRRIDYFLGKLGVIGTFLGRMIVLPCIIAYVLGLLFSLDWTIFRDTLPLLLSSIVYGVIISVSAGLLMLALSSLSRSSRYVALFWLGIWFVGGVTSTILQASEHEQRRHAMYRQLSAATMNQPGDPLRQQEAWMQAHMRMQQQLMAEELRASERDWRPMTSYTANLSRVGRQLLGTNARWQSLSKLVPAGEREMFLMTMMGPSYPWIWSAGVLLGLFGLSACILNLQVKSLDRLR
jgi:ABC-2 type transport system permease protein